LQITLWFIKISLVDTTEMWEILVTRRVSNLEVESSLSGTLCPRTCVIRMFLRTVTGSHWRRFLFLQY